MGTSKRSRGADAGRTRSYQRNGRETNECEAAQHDADIEPMAIEKWADAMAEIETSDTLMAAIANAANYIISWNYY